MPKKMKLNLDELKVESFVTTLEEIDKLKGAKLEGRTLRCPSGGTICKTCQLEGSFAGCGSTLVCE